jgi:hypothetical protein
MICSEIGYISQICVKIPEKNYRIFFLNSISRILSKSNVLLHGIFWGKRFLFFDWIKIGNSVYIYGLITLMFDVEYNEACA